MAQKGDVELIIRAKNDASKSLDAISSSLKNLKDQQVIVGDSANKTDGQLAALSLELTKLRTNAQNLQQLANIGQVLNTATAALSRQKQAVADAATESDRLVSQQGKLKSQQQDLASSLKTATSELTKQQEAVTGAKNSLSTFSKESTALSTGQRQAQRSLDAVTKLIGTQEAALSTAAAKHAQLAAAVNETDKPTKRLTSSLEAAERALVKRQAALDASRAKEAGLQETLRQNAAAQEANAAATQKAAASLDMVSKAADAAKNNVAKLATESKSLGQSQAQVDREVAKSATNLNALKTSLDTAENEYKQLTTAADQAKAVVGQTAAVTTNAGQAAVQAAAQLATFAARARVLQQGGGKTTSPLNLDVGQITSAVGALRNTQAVVTATERSYSAAAVSAHDLENAIASMGKVYSQLTPLAAAVASQKTAIDGAYQSWKTAEAEVKRLAIAMQSAAQPSEALAAALGTAQGQARLAKNEFTNQENVAKQLGQSLQQAGFGAGTLATAEGALANALRSASDTSTKASAGLARIGQASESSGQSTARFSDYLGRLKASGGSLAGALGQAAGGIAKIREGAASASGPVGSLAGELKGLAAQAVGLYAVKEGIAGILDTSTNFDALGAKIRVAFGGDLDAANKAMDYSLQVAKNLKLPLLETAKGYADMAVSARGTALEGKGVNDIFTAFAQAARVTRTSTADLDGIFRALTQSISKGKVQAEELRGQLGDRLPGAIQIMAQALGVSTTKLDDMLQKGELTIDTLQRMAGEVSKRVAPELAAALDSPAAKIQEFKNRWTELQLELAKSGFLDAIATAAENFGKALSDPNTIESVKQLGIGVADLVNWFGQLEDPVGKVQTALGIIISLQVASWITGILGGLTAMATGLYAVAAAAAAADFALAPVLLTIGGIAALLATPFLAEWAYNNFPAFAEGWLTAKSSAGSAMDGIVLSAETMGTGLKTVFLTVINYINQKWAELISYLAGSAAQIGSAVGFEGMNEWAAKMQSEAEQAAKGTSEAWSNGMADIDKERQAYADKEAARQKALTDEIEAYRKAHTATKPPAGPTVVKPGDGTTGVQQVTGPTTPFKPDTTKADEAAAKKRVALEKRVADEIAGIQSSLNRNKANDLDTQIRGVEEKYAKLYADLRTLGKGQQSEEWKQVDALKAQEIQLVRNAAAKKAERAATKAKNDEQKAAEKQINDLMSLRRDLLQQIKYAESQGDYTTADKLREQYNGVNEQLKQAIDAQIKYWEAAGGPQADLAIAKLKAQRDGLANVKNNAILTAQTVGTQLGQSLNSFGSNFLDNIAQTGDVFQSLKDSFRQFASEFLLQIAKMILQQALFNALQGAAGGGGIFGGIFGAAASAVGSAHTGGVVGGTGLNQRNVNPGIFAGAAKYHTGGVVGLQPWEVPIVAAKGEEVLTENDPRHINNIGTGGDSTNGGNGNSSMPNFQIINAIDADQVVQQGLSSPAGTKTFMNLIQANRSKIKGLIG